MVDYNLLKLTIAAQLNTLDVVIPNVLEVADKLLKSLIEIGVIKVEEETEKEKETFVHVGTI